LRQFVLWTGLSSFLAGLAVQFPVVFDHLHTSEPPGMLLRLFGVMAMFLGAALALCARDLKSRGSIVIWEGILRIGGFAVLTGYGVFGGRGIVIALCGILDLLIGVIYLFALPRHLGVPLIDLLLDRQTTS
jgi:hypothetical protein